MSDETYVPVPVAERVTGIIIPPPDIKKIVNKTAVFIGRRGKAFESKIMESQKSNISFGFLNPDNPYHAFYLHQLQVCIDRGSMYYVLLCSLVQNESELEADEEGNDSTNKDQDSSNNNVISAAEPSKLAPLVAMSRNLPEGTPPERQFPCIHPQLIKMFDMDLIKLTAQYTALNGKKFLAGIAEREAKNPQFDFVKPTHMLFKYFTSLVELYTKLINPTEGIKHRLETNVNDKMTILGRCVHRVEYARREEQKRKKVGISEEEAEYNAIDWYDFEIVETIDISNLDDETSTKPTQPTIDTNESDMELDEDEEQQQQQQELQQQQRQQQQQQLQQQQQYHQIQNQQQNQNNTNNDDSNSLIRENYQPRAKPVQMSTTSLYDPVTKRNVPIDQSGQHARYSTIDPRYESQHHKFMEGFETSNLAQDSEISRNLSEMSTKRPDIFHANNGDNNDSSLGHDVKRVRTNQYNGSEFTEEQRAQMFRQTLVEKQKAGLFPQRGASNQPSIGPQQPPPSQ